MLTAMSLCCVQAWRHVRSHSIFLFFFHIPSRCRDSSVGIATRCGLDGTGFESRWGSRFSAPVQTSPEAHPAFYTISTGSFPGVKRPGRGIEHPPPSSAEVKERVALYLYSPSGHSWPVRGWNLPIQSYSIAVYEDGEFPRRIWYS